MILPEIPMRWPVPWLPIQAWLVNLLKAMFTPSKKKETPQDIAERNRWQREFTDYVNRNTEAVEQQIVLQVRSYADYLVEISQTEISRYKINTRPFIHEVELLNAQIPGTVSGEVSRHMTDSDAEYCKIRRMISGSEKEQAMQRFLQEIIDSGVEKCDRLAQQVFNQIEEDLIAMLQERVDQSCQQLERTRQDLKCLASAIDDRKEQERLKAQAELIWSACNFTEGLFNEKEG